jgi:hypothetical protein
MTPPLSHHPAFQSSPTIVFHNDGGANCFIVNNSSYFWRLHSTSVAVRQVNGSTIQASGFGIIIICPPTESVLIALWPCYLYPSAPQCTFSLTAFKHYLQIPSVITEHTVHLAISLTDDLVIRFPSCPHQVKDSRLDYFSAEIMIPCPQTSPSVSIQCAPLVCFSKAPTLTRTLLHQRFAHCSDDVLDTMCQKQTAQGLPKRPPL